MNRKEFYILAMITFLTVLAWIAFGIIYARSPSSIDSLKLNEFPPLTPTFDNEIINQLNNRRRQ